MLQFLCGYPLQFPLIAVWFLNSQFNVGQATANLEYNRSDIHHKRRRKRSKKKKIKGLLYRAIIFGVLGGGIGWIFDTLFHDYTSILLGITLGWIGGAVLHGGLRRLLKALLGIIIGTAVGIGVCVIPVFIIGFNSIELTFLIFFMALGGCIAVVFL